MKKVLSVLLVLIVLITSVPLTFANGNMNGGGGGMGGGTEPNYINPGWDGVRISMFNVSTKTVVAVEDFTNKSIPNSVIHYGKVSKVNYRNGMALTEKNGGYTHKTLPGMPHIIAYTNCCGIGANHKADAVKTFFTKKENIDKIANEMGVSYTDIQHGKIKMLLEPIGYFVWQYESYAMTATQAALIDKKTGGQLKYDHRPLSHNNLPLAMFLESYDKDVNIEPYTGDKTLLCSRGDPYQEKDDLIVNRLGIGIVYEINGEPIGLPPPTGTVNASNYEFRTDTDVIISVNFVNTGADVISTSENKVRMCFTEPNGTEHDIEFHCPKGNSQLVWFKWRTPSDAQTYTITARPWQRVNKETGAWRWISDSPVTITCKVTKPTETPPPDPQYTDKDKKKYTYSENTLSVDKLTTDGKNTTDGDTMFKGASAGSTGRTSNSWSVHEYSPATGTWSLKTYTANLNAAFKVKAGTPYCPTATLKSGKYEIKSGYGFEVECTANVSGNGAAHTTNAQNVWTYFNEWGYKDCNRFLEKVGGVWQFKQNGYTVGKYRIHLTPLWFPDGKQYKTEVLVFDAWTPAGQLYTTASDFVAINGDCLDDWYISRNK